jgi:hypothetical protein
MLKIFVFIISFYFVCSYSIAQKVLPDITVKNLNGQIVVSWKNEYTKPIATINIQRSFDSTKNYTTIGSVLNPQNIENGYADEKPPYNKMYYRLFIAYEGGTYIFSKTTRPIVENKSTADSSIENNLNSDVNVVDKINNPYQFNPQILAKPKLPVIQNEDNKQIITYPSKRIFTAKENNIVIYLPEAALKKYTAKFFNEKEELIFEMNKIEDSYLIIEKVNFVHAGWFYFEIYENGKLIEKNKFFIAKDIK